MERTKVLSIVGIIVTVLLAAVVTGGLFDKSNDADGGTGLPRNNAAGNGNSDPAEIWKDEIAVSLQSQTASGIRVDRLGEFKYTEEIKAYGQVLGLNGLITLRDEFVTEKTAARKADLQLAIARNEYQRATALFNRSKYLSLQQLQDAEAAYYSDLADSESAIQNVAGIKAEIAQQWGDRIADMVSEEAPLIRDIIQHRFSLVMLTLPVQATIGHAPRVAEVETANGALVKSYLVSISPVSNPNIQGVSYFYKVRTIAALPTGTNVIAFLNVGKEIEGVVIPSSAVVWLNGSAYVFVRKGREQFVRIEIAAAKRIGDGWFVHLGIKPGDQLVINGAQLLLSEEFKGESQGDGD